MAKANGGGVAILENMIEAARKRRFSALAMREGGMTVQEVADKLGVTRQRAFDLITRAKKEQRSKA